MALALLTPAANVRGACLGTKSRRVSSAGIDLAEAQARQTLDFGLGPPGETGRRSCDIQRSNAYTIQTSLMPESFTMRGLLVVFVVAGAVLVAAVAAHAGVTPP
jgi:hypothetical protein